MTISHHGGRSYEHICIYSDGAVQPDRAGAGIVVLDRWEQIVRITNRVLPTMTNNEAEYAGLILALEAAAHLGAEYVEIRLDSEVVVYQMSGRFAVNSSALKRLNQQACELARALTRVGYTHIPRERNLLADALATEASFGRLWQTESRR